MPKKTIMYLSVGVLILLTTILLLRSDNKIENYPSSRKGIVAFGDSLVAGLGSTNDNDFVTLLSKSLGTPIENQGKNGDTTATAINRLDGVLAVKSRIVIILFGGNDFLNKIPKKDTFQNLEKIIQSIQNDGSIVLLIGIRGGILTDPYQSEFKELALKYQTAYVPDILNGLIENPALMYDAIHPNNAGYKIISNKIYPVIKDLLN